MNNDIEKDFNLGGSVDKALSGQYDLKVGEVLKEAGSMTVKHFLSFSPAVMILLVLQLAIFYIALKLQIGDPSIVLDIFENPENFNQSIVQAIFVANFSYEVVSAPFFAGLSLMAMSHAAGLNTKLRHIGKGLQFTVPVIIATLFSLILQGIAGTFLPFVSLYLSLAFSNSILLVCEKRVSPFQSLWMSLRAVNKKILSIAAIYSVVTMLFVAAAVFYGIGLIFVLPFFFHVKGIIYRNMFGIKLKVYASEKSNDDTPNDDHHNKDSRFFDA
ncbi:membrane protein [Vibrio genomosp. F10]|uniref:Proline and glycine rich transmembrane protein gene in bax n=1 Tax=Vibrio genomosp. F10 TaxID=723171 RepID=A0A1B9QVX0_9VIBR|nr:membrane protein [Vibrio genomosp. F10]OCH73400.1 hypothetical protein A6E14_14535 [Vibrio genomosp. F10]OEE94344.1 hypothetical protein A1QK_16560 [Vibrio genomosp. F10 str. 9ZD137]OEE96433.1 hypothetical protein A1QM_16970 [Vibrio genomosp. F10 str. 9ZC157]OEF05196.1 hypothetical protein A1QI_09015 [Vibrio genomosp. F10 str. 9ZB36]